MCKLTKDKYRKAADKSAAHGEEVKDEWNAGSDRAKLWLVHGKLVGSVVAGFMTSWAFKILVGHTGDTVGYNLSTLEDAGLEKWSSVAYVKQGTGTIS